MHDVFLSEYFSEMGKHFGGFRQTMFLVLKRCKRGLDSD